MKLFSVVSLFLLSFLLISCDTKTSADSYLGTWENPEMTFSVSLESGSTSKVLITNENGVLKGEITKEGIVGKNELGMDFKMQVKGDSAFYTFAEVTTKYSKVKK